MRLIQTLTAVRYLTPVSKKDSTIIDTINARVEAGQGPMQPREIRFLVQVWHNATMVHQFFKSRCGDRKDSNGQYLVYWTDLDVLLLLCQQVLACNAAAGRLLPPATEYACGPTVIDDAYFDILRETVEVLTEITKSVDPEHFDFHYFAEV